MLLDDDVCNKLFAQKCMTREGYFAVICVKLFSHLRHFQIFNLFIAK